MVGMSSVVVVVETAAAKEKAEEERKAATTEPAAATVALVTTPERVPESHIARVKARPMRKMPPISDNLFANNPKLRASLQGCIDHVNYMVDMEQDCLRQHADKGYAEVGVDFTSGVKRMFILPQRSLISCSPELR